MVHFHPVEISNQYLTFCRLEEVAKDQFFHQFNVSVYFLTSDCCNITKLPRKQLLGLLLLILQLWAKLESTVIDNQYMKLVSTKMAISLQLCEHMSGDWTPSKSKYSTNNHLHHSLDCCLSRRGHHNLSRRDINETKSTSSV